MFTPPRRLGNFKIALVVGLVGVSALGIPVLLYSFRPTKEQTPGPALAYKERIRIDTAGFREVFNYMETWPANATLADYTSSYEQAVPRGLADLDKQKSTADDPRPMRLIRKANLLNSCGDAVGAYKVLEEIEAALRGNYSEEIDGQVLDWGTQLDEEMRYTVVFYLGVTALRIGENDNCVHCRGQSACIFPILPAAVHTNPTGSRNAIKHFTEYLARFPDDLEVKWLLNLAHMTLGEYPDKVDPRHRLSFDAFARSEFDIGQFRDVSHLVGLERMNLSGGGIMEDFDNDGLFDIVVSSCAHNEKMGYFRNKGDGAFENVTQPSRLDGQIGGLYCVQTDYNNDGRLDIFVPRGAWHPVHLAQRPSLLKNNKDGTFTDVTGEAGLLTPTNSTSATWADFNNDGFLDLFVCCQNQPCLLYANNGDGTFESVADRAGLADALSGILGAAWIDYDNDDFPDLFVNQGKGVLNQFDKFGSARLYHNNRNGTFTNVTAEMGIDGPRNGFSCWAFDFDNDGWLDILATTVNHTPADIVRGLLDQPQTSGTARLYRNLQGKRFEDVTEKAGITKAYAPMGSNFGDVDNDGYLDFYLGTGNPDLGTLVPNRLYKNVGGERFAEITASSRTGHLQKGHSVAFGDWDRNGAQDLFIELGGAIKGDSYHNVLFQNPGHGTNWLSVKLVGQATNRAAIGARILVETAGDKPQKIHRHVSSGSSFGANPLEQHFGLGQAQRVARIEIHWPTSGTTQVFQDVAVNQGLVVAELATSYETRSWKPIPVPE